MDVERKSLEELQTLLDEEAELWEAIGIDIGMIPHDNTSLFILKQQNQAMLNLLMMKGLVTEEEINVEFKTLMLNSMVSIRKERENQLAKAMVGKPELALPSHKLLGPDGEELKL